MVIIKIITYCLIGPMSLLMTGWTTIEKWLPTLCGVCIGGMTCCSSTKCTYVGT